MIYTWYAITRSGKVHYCYPSQFVYSSIATSPTKHTLDSFFVLAPSTSVISAEEAPQPMLLACSSFEKMDRYVI